MSDYQVNRFIDKFLHSLEVALDSQPNSGICGFEIEWNLLDSKFQPLRLVGEGANQKSFIDYFREDYLPIFARERTQLEVYHWMIEWATKPYYEFVGAVNEIRLAEAILLNSLSIAGAALGERLYYWHGNLLSDPEVDHYSIPGSWHRVKRRYLEKCVDLFGHNLATTGIHTNISIPEPLIEWDFVHLPIPEHLNGSPLHLDDYKNLVYIRATRILRAFTALFIATSASTPMKAVQRNGRKIVILSEYDSIRNLTFPNPSSLDIPYLYRSYEDYVSLSYDLVNKGIRFGNNNWTPVRARSFAEPVERLIAITNEQLHELYSRGLYAEEHSLTIEEMAKQIEIQNLLARINLPMARVEIRTDEGGHSFEVDYANLIFKYLIFLRCYSDLEFANNFHYDAEDIQRARINEHSAALWGLKAEIENPIDGKHVSMRDFLKWILNEIKPLAKGLELWDALLPIREMMKGGPNTATVLRNHIKKHLGKSDEVPLELLQELAQKRESEIVKEVSRISSESFIDDRERKKIDELLSAAKFEFCDNSNIPIRFVSRSLFRNETTVRNKLDEIIDLAHILIRIPSITASPNENLDEVRRAAQFIYDYSINCGLDVRYFNKGKYPALLIGFPDYLYTPVMFCGHFDVVEPEPDERQFIPFVEGDYLWGRGSADMKTVVATYLIWFKYQIRKGYPYPPINLLLIGNEENGEKEAMGTPHVLQLLKDELNYQPELMVVGERTGENGSELWGDICTKNRGIIRIDIKLKGKKLHSGTAKSAMNKFANNVMDQLLKTKNDILKISNNLLTMNLTKEWRSNISFPYIQIGTVGVFNITPDSGLLGVEIRPIPEDDINELIEQLVNYSQVRGLEIEIHTKDNGVICNESNPYLQKLIHSVSIASGKEPSIGSKLPGTSARFAPMGNAVVWGQSGIGPHAIDERHFIPSIMPYYSALDEYSNLLLTSKMKP